MFFKLFLSLLFSSFLAANGTPAFNNTEKWSKSKLTYDILRYPKDVSRKDTLDAFGYAFNQVGKILNIKFGQVFMFSGKPADIRIVFARNISLISSNSHDGIIAFDDNTNFKYYKPGDYMYELQPYKPYVDLTWSAMYEIRQLLQNNKVNGSEFIHFDRALNSLMHYIQPKFVRSLKRPY